MKNHILQRPSQGEYALGYQKYLDLVPDGDYMSLLHENLLKTIRRFEEMPAEKLDYVYAQDKWTPKEVLMHIVDTERVFSYRALVAARSDMSMLHYRMDEELYARNVDVSGRTLESLLTEFKAVRASTGQLFENITEPQSEMRCNIVTHPMSARAIGYFIIGHVEHHLNVIAEKYF
ncbi:MAG TPA: DinB family protein [Pyrinomonadaceae bacterium]|jgi:DinB superfamily|nr:DinB family protein [Pyrinomonadaceae bacterium]